MLCLLANNALTYPYGAGGGFNSQWPQQQQHGGQGYGGQGFGGQGSGGSQRGAGYYGGNSQGRGGGQSWQSAGQAGAEAYQSNVFNEPDRYGYDYTIPGAMVHYLMYKKREYRTNRVHHCKTMGVHTASGKWEGDLSPSVDF